MGQDELGRGTHLRERVERLLAESAWLFRLLFFKQVKCAVCAEIGQSELCDRTSANNRTLLDDVEALAVHQVPEVGHGHEVDVGRFVPLKRKRLGHRRSPSTQHFQPDPPVTKIRDNDQCPFCHTQHFQQEFAGITNLLQGLAEYSEVETVVRDINQSPIKVSFDDRQSAIDDRENIVECDFHSEHAAVQFCMQACKQASIAAAKVNDPAAWLDVVHDEFVGQTN